METKRSHSEYAQALARLAVRFGANLQRGQILAIASEPGKEHLARAIAEEAYAHGAMFVDLSVFDVHFKRARARYADPETLSFGLRGWANEPARWANTAAPESPSPVRWPPGPSRGFARRCWVATCCPPYRSRCRWWMREPRTGLRSPVPRRPGPRSSTRISIPPTPSTGWDQVAYVCRLDEADPVAAWRQRLAMLGHTAGKLDDLRLDRLHFKGPGTDLTIGLLPSSHWCAAHFTTVDGIEHAPNLPTEEVFTTPDPERVEGTVTATKPLFTAGTTITGLKVRFSGGRAVSIEADEGAEVVCELSEHDDGAARLGEVALVDREGRIGPLDTVFYDTLIDENASSHIAIGQGYGLAVKDPAELPRANQSGVHVDFMIGGDDVAVTGYAPDGREIPLLRAGAWQI